MVWNANVHQYQSQLYRKPQKLASPPPTPPPANTFRPPSLLTSKSWMYIWAGPRIRGIQQSRIVVK